MSWLGYESQRRGFIGFASDGNGFLANLDPKNMCILYVAEQNLACS